MIPDGFDWITQVSPSPSSDFKLGSKMGQGMVLNLSIVQKKLELRKYLQ